MLLPNSDGVYVYEHGMWRKILAEGPFVPEMEGVYAIYFRNLRCPGCSVFDDIWLKFVSLYSANANYVVIQCKNFFVECNDITASDSFIFYLVFETPQVIVVVVKDDIPIYIEREVGVLSMEKLKDFILNVRDRISLEVPEEHEEIEEGIYIDFSKKNWREIAKQLRELIFKGKIPHEVCTEEGCKIVIE